MVGFVIDRSPAARGWRASAEELVGRLRRTGAPVRCWWHDGDPGVVANVSGGAASRRLTSLRDEVDALVIVGEVDVSVRELGAALRRFPRRLWLHPLPRARWTEGERALEAVIPMAQASVEALASLGEGHADDADDARAPWSLEAERYPGSVAGVAALAAYLGEAFPWLCAAAVSGRPDRALARLLGPMVGAPRLAWSAWLRLATLPWWDKDAWPEALREALQRELGEGMHRALTEALLARVEAAELAEDSAAWWLREMERASLEAALGRGDPARVAALLASPMRGAVREGEGGVGRRVRAHAAWTTWRQAWRQLAGVGVGAGVVAAGAGMLGATE